MTGSLVISRHRRRVSGGNALVENVFTLLPTLAMIFMMSDMGIALFRWSTLQNAVREGSRYAVTFDHTVNGVSVGQDAAIKAKVAEYAMNMVTTTDNPVHIFVNYYPADGTTTTPIAVGANPPGNSPGNVVEVSVQNISLSWLGLLSSNFASLSGSFGAGTPFYRNSTPVSLAVYSADIMGGYPINVTSVAR